MMQNTLKSALSLCAALTILFFSSCKKDPQKPATTEQPAVRPVGNPIGEAASFQANASGGHFTTADHSIEITIPSGAVSTATTFTVQEVENTCLGSVGKSFSITPHVAEFAKPVTIRFSYEASADTVSLPESLNAAYQDADGVWRAVPNVTLDKNTKTVSVTTTHFSNWTLFNSLKLIPAKTTIGAEEEVSLQLLSFLPTGMEDELAPLTPRNGKDVGICIGHPLDTKYIKKWNLGGIGDLTPNGATAVYKSPATVTQPEVVAVSVDLNIDDLQRLVVSNITVIGSGMAFRINGGAWRYVASYAYQSSAGKYAIVGTDPSEEYGVILQWQGGTGSFSWTDGKTEPVTMMNLGNTTSTLDTYISVFQHSDGSIEPSGGSLKIDEAGAVKNSFVSGSFRATKAGHLGSNGLQIGSATIDGYFHALRSN